MKNKLNKHLIQLIAFVHIIATGCFIGANGQESNKPVFKFPSDLKALEKQIIQSEQATPGIRQGCEAKIVWADSTRKAKTKYVFLYIHGFSASPMEGDPVHRNIAKTFAANLYLARLSGHGIDLGDSTMAGIGVDDFEYSAEHALAIAKAIGNEVIIMSNSFGGALSCWLASRHPEIKTLVLYSPCIRVHDARAEMIAQPGAVAAIAKQQGSVMVEFPPISEEFAKYWTTRYHLDGIAAFQVFLFREINKETFKKIKCPVFLGYWYKNENEKDTVVSLPAMFNMFDELGSKTKEKIVFPDAGNHTMLTPVLTTPATVEDVQRETGKFLKRILQE